MMMHGLANFRFISFSSGKPYKVFGRANKTVFRQVTCTTRWYTTN